MSESDSQKPVHTAYAKVLVELDANPRLFLSHNQHYDRHRVGRFCENNGRDELALVAYRKGKSINCDTQFLHITTKREWWEEQASFLLER